MVDGTAYLGTFMRYLLKTPAWSQPRGQNLLDSGSPFYDVYQCRDGGYVAVGALEPKFFSELLRGLGLDQRWTQLRNDPASWPELREILESCFSGRTRWEWETIFSGKDACVTPVLSQAELEEEGYEQRPAVELTGSPALPVPKEAAWQGQALSPGSGGEKALQDWMGWKSGKEFAYERGGLVKLITAKL